jgi:hypothetical protein
MPKTPTAGQIHHVADMAIQNAMLVNSTEQLALEDLTSFTEDLVNICINTMHDASQEAPSSDMAAFFTSPEESNYVHFIEDNAAEDEQQDF